MGIIHNFLQLSQNMTTDYQSVLHVLCLKLLWNWGSNPYWAGQALLEGNQYLMFLHSDQRSNAHTYMKITLFFVFCCIQIFTVYKASFHVDIQSVVMFWLNWWKKKSFSLEITCTIYCLFLCTVQKLVQNEECECIGKKVMSLRHQHAGRN